MTNAPDARGSLSERAARLAWRARAFVLTPSVLDVLPALARQAFGFRKRDPWAHVSNDDQYADLLRRYPVEAGRYRDAGVRIAVIDDGSSEHTRYLKACEELGVECRLVAWSASDWLARLRDAKCHGVLVHPMLSDRVRRARFDERLWTMSRGLGLPTFPLPHEAWLYESKRRMADWLDARDIPRAATRIFYSRDEAHAFAANAEYPILCKSDLGASGDGVTLVRSRREAGRLVERAFLGGLPRRGSYWCDAEWGVILFQDFIPDAREFRILQFGQAWFGHEKLREAGGWRHSGSGNFAWTVPPEAALDLCLRTSRVGGFRAMNYDVLWTEDGRPLINELQAFFGSYNPSQMYVDGKPGRLLAAAGGGWRFEEGLFCRNGCGNLRVEALVEDILAARAAAKEGA